MPVVIRSTTEGFRRCGEAHSKNPVTWPDDHFSEDELEILMAEPKLSVTITPAETVPENEKPELDPSIIAAARKAIENEDTITSGAPDIKAMEAILKGDVTKDQRDQAFEIIRAEGKE